jgi:hypothetical protein
MAERVARAICRGVLLLRCGTTGIGPDLSPQAATVLEVAEDMLWRDYLPTAQGALEELRHPDGTMVDAGAGTFVSTGSNQYSVAGQPSTAWRAMIDAVIDAIEAEPRTKPEDAS